MLFRCVCEDDSGWDWKLHQKAEQRENSFSLPDRLWMGTSVFFCLQTQTHTLSSTDPWAFECRSWDISVSIITWANSLSICRTIYHYTYLSSISYLYIYTFIYLYLYWSYRLCCLENPAQYRNSGHMRLPLTSFTFPPIFCIRIWSILPRCEAYSYLWTTCEWQWFSNKWI